LTKDEIGNYLDLPDPSINTLFIDDVEIHTTTYQDVEYEYYVLKLSMEGDNMPNFTDDIALNYS
jgi:hypothetical protein